MKFFVNEHCMGCNLCIEICPSVFSKTEFGAAEAIREEAPSESIPDAQLAQDICPAYAIEKMA